MRDNSFITMKHPGKRPLVLLTVWLVVHLQSAIASPSFVTIEAVPDKITPGLTKHMTVNCSYTHGSDSALSTLLTLIIGKVTSAGNGTSEEIATVTAFTDSRINIMRNVSGAQIAGHHSPKGDSYITLTWLYPTDEAQGVYTCVAHGADHVGHPNTDHMTVNVSQQAVDLNQILAVMEKSDAKIDTLLKWKSDLAARFQNSHDALMQVSTTYGGHSYDVSRPVLKNSAVENSVCHLYGGYATELDDQQEVHFFSDLVQNNTATHSLAVSLGASKSGQTGQWMLETSGDRMTYIDWAAGQPTGDAGEDCLFMGTTRHSRTAMYDEQCLVLGHARFSCEF